MVYVSEEVMDRLKGRSPTRSLEMTEDERARAGQYFRIQIPITDRRGLKHAAERLRRIASMMDVCSSMWQQRDYQLINIVKGEIALAHAHFRHARYMDATEAETPAATQNDGGEADQD